MFKRKASEEKKDSYTEEVARIIKFLSTEDQGQYWDFHHASKDTFNAYSRDGLVIFGFTISLGGGELYYGTTTAKRKPEVAPEHLLR